MQVIGITGRKRHGKDTVARELLLKGFTIVRFAEPLKNMLRAFYATHNVPAGIVERKIEGDLKEQPCDLLAGKSPRYAMQTLGTEWGRNLIDPDFWINSFKTRVVGNEKVAVPDVRFANECAAVHDVGGHVWRIDACGRVASTDGSGHASEAEIDRLPVELEISNNGTPFELSCAVNAALE